MLLLYLHKNCNNLLPVNIFCLQFDGFLLYICLQIIATWMHVPACDTSSSAILSSVLEWWNCPRRAKYVKEKETEMNLWQRITPGMMSEEEEDDGFVQHRFSWQSQVWVKQHFCIYRSWEPANCTYSAPTWLCDALRHSITLWRNMISIVGRETRGSP